MRFGLMMHGAKLPRILSIAGCALLAGCDANGYRPAPVAAADGPDTLPGTFTAVRAFCSLTARPTPPGDPGRTVRRLAIGREAVLDVDATVSIDAGMRCVIRRRPEMELLWRTAGAHPDPAALPALGAGEMWILAAAGEKPSDADRIVVDSVGASGDTTFAWVREFAAGEEGGMVITYPAMAVRVPSTEHVVFYESAGRPAAD